MQIGLKDLEPELAEAIEERLTGPVDNFLSHDIAWKKKPGSGRLRPPTADERRAHDLRKREAFYDRQLPMIALGVLQATFIGLLLAAIIAPTNAMGFNLVFLSIALPYTAVSTLHIRRRSSRRRLRRKLSIEEMRAVFPLLSLSKAERIYCDAVQLLAVAETSIQSEVVMRDTLSHLNTLLTASRNLEKRRRSLLPLLGSNVISELGVELEKIKQQLDATTDPLAQQSLEHSVQMCSERITNARALSDGMARVQAQQEALIQTLSSALSALGRMQLVQDTGSVAHEIAEKVSAMNQQTYAVEKAVEEVMLLGRQ